MVKNYYYFFFVLIGVIIIIKPVYAYVYDDFSGENNTMLNNSKWVYKGNSPSTNITINNNVANLSDNNASGSTTVLSNSFSGLYYNALSFDFWSKLTNSKGNIIPQNDTNMWLSIGLNPTAINQLRFYYYNGSAYSNILSRDTRTQRNYVVFFDKGHVKVYEDSFFIYARPYSIGLINHTSLGTGTPETGETYIDNLYFYTNNPLYPNYSKINNNYGNGWILTFNATKSLGFNKGKIVSFLKTDDNNILMPVIQPFDTNAEGGLIHFLNSNDNGKTWTEKSNISHLEFNVNLLHGLAINSTGAIFYPRYGSGVNSDNSAILYQSTDNGLTWQILKTFAGQRHIHSMGIDTLNDDIYVLTGDGEGQLWKYNNTWNNLTSKITLDGGNPRLILFDGNNITLGTEQPGRIWTSNNNGETWINKANLTNGEILCLTKIDNTYYACVEPGRIYKSEDKGETWTNFYDFPSAYVFSIIKTGSGDFYVSLGNVNNNTISLVQKSSDNGQTWTNELDLVLSNNMSQSYLFYDEINNHTYMGLYGSNNNSGLLLVKQVGGIIREIPILLSNINLVDREIRLFYSNGSYITSIKNTTVFMFQSSSNYSIMLYPKKINILTNPKTFVQNINVYYPLVFSVLIFMFLGYIAYKMVGGKKLWK